MAVAKVGGQRQRERDDSGGGVARVFGHVQLGRANDLRRRSVHDAHGAGGGDRARGTDDAHGLAQVAGVVADSGRSVRAQLLRHGRFEVHEPVIAAQRRQRHPHLDGVP